MCAKYILAALVAIAFSVTDLLASLPHQGAANGALAIDYMRKDIDANRRAIAALEPLLTNLMERIAILEANAANRAEIDDAHLKEIQRLLDKTLERVDLRHNSFASDCQGIDRSLKAVSEDLTAAFKIIEKQAEEIVALQDRLQTAVQLMQKQDKNIGSLHDALISLAEEAQQPATTSISIQPSQMGYYTVLPGDSLAKIAKKFNITVKALREANQLPNDKIIVGKKLAIPPKESS